MAATILIADDDPVQRRLVENMVLRSGYQAVTVDSGDAAIAHLVGDSEPRIDAMVLDLVMPGLDGMGVLAKLREAGIAVPVIVQTAHGGIDNVVSAMRAGAHDFVVKPVGLERLQVSLRNALNASALKGELQRIKHSREGRLTFADIVTRSAAMASGAADGREGRRIVDPGADRRRIRRRQGTDRARDPRIERARGKALRRRQLRRDPGQSRRVDPVRPREGRLHRRHRAPHRQVRRSFAAARCFSTRSASCRLRAQVKLLRALQEGEVEAVGGRKPVKVDVRIISATNRNLLERAKSGQFREDLFYRLHVLPLTVPPLRARAEDVPHLLRHFLARFCAEENRNITAVSAEALAALTAFPGPATCGSWRTPSIGRW